MFRWDQSLLTRQFNSRGSPFFRFFLLMTLVTPLIKIETLIFFLGCVWNRSPIHCSIGARRSSNVSCKTINLFNVWLHHGDKPNHNVDINQWNSLFKNQNIFNRIDSEKVIDEALYNSETDAQKKVRKELKEKLHFDLKYKEESKRYFKNWVTDLEKKVGKEIKTFYFLIKDLNGFLMQYYEKDGKKSSKIC